RMWGGSCLGKRSYAASVCNGLSRGTIHEGGSMRTVFHSLAVLLLLLGLNASPALAQPAPVQPVPVQPAPGPEAAPPPGQTFAPGELVATGHRFFGGVSRGLATIIEKAVSQWGLPNGYILGQEAGGAVVVGLRYGEGVLYTKNAGDLKVFWQGPSVGW